MFGKLESLRGVAACLVVIFHSSFSFGLEPLAFFDNSYLFVDFFFILSGFVMSFAYADKISDGMPFKKYIFLRLGRIYPLHLFMLLVWVPYILMKQYLYTSGYGGSDQFEKSNIFTFISNVFLVHSMGIHSDLSWNGPSWSISTEFFAYIAFFFVSALIDRKKTLFVPALISIACYMFLYSLGGSSLNITTDYGFFRCLGAFYSGVLLYRLRPMIPNVDSPKALTVLELTSIILVVYTVSNAFLSKPFIGLSLLSFIFTVAVFSNSQSGVFGNLLENKLMRSIGLWSYSIYLIHAIVMLVAANVAEYLLKINMNQAFEYWSVLINIVLLSLIILISKYTYIYVEKHFRDAVKRKVEKNYNSIL